MTSKVNFFKQCSAALDQFFAVPAHADLADFCVRAGNAKHDASDVFSGLQHCLSEIRQLHQSFQRVAGMSSARGEDVPTMSYFVDYVDRRGKTAGGDALALAQQMNQGRPFEAEDVSKEAFRNLLLEFGVLNYLLMQPDAAQAFHELQTAQRKQADGLLADAHLPLINTGREHTDAQEFSMLRHATTRGYEGLQKTLGVSIPTEAAKELIEYPLTASLSRASLDDIRAQFFQLPADDKGPFAAKLLKPAAYGAASFKRQ
jgi:hypothetical protein